MGRKGTLPHTPPINLKFNGSTQLNAVLADPMVAQLCALLKSGLLHMSMASDLGEMERKAASEQPLFWWRLEAPTRRDRPASVTRQQLRSFFGLPG
jgi:hypothetical protein